MKVKNLISLTLEENKKLKDTNIISPIIEITDSLTLLEAIDILRTNKTNFAAVVHHESRLCMGIITLKQIFENLVLKEFNDNDVRVNVTF